MLATALLLLLIPAVAPAQVLYGIDSNNNQLLGINPSTASTVVVGSLGFPATAGSAAFANGTLYGLIRDGSDGLDKLFSIDTATGAATALVTVDQQVGGRGMNFSPDNTTVYYTDRNEFWTMDPSTGVSTLIGTMTSAASQMARDDEGIYYVLHSSGLNTLDPDTGATTFVGTVDQIGAGLSWNPSDGLLYTVAGGNLYTIDPQTAATTLIGNVGFTCNGLAFDYGPVPAEKNSWGRMKSNYQR
jgi:DNA-binding beta-propeller fold protein YncE